VGSDRARAGALSVDGGRARLCASVRASGIVTTLCLRGEGGALRGDRLHRGSRSSLGARDARGCRRLRERARGGHRESENRRRDRGRARSECRARGSGGAGGGDAVTTGWERPAGVDRRLILVRHGEPEASSKGRCYGKLDVGLSDKGREQMARVANALASTKIDAVYASPRRRARESAEVLSGELVVDRRLSEIDFGELEGLTYEEAEREFPHLYKRWMQEPTEVKFPGGESFAEMKVRVLEAFSVIRDVHAEQTVVVVSHGGVNRIVLAHALGVDAKSIFHMDQSHAGVSIVDDYEDYSVVRFMNVSC